MHSILIVGAGVAGPVTALRFTQAGYDCTVVERAPSAQTIGGAINIAPNGMRLFDRLGLREEIEKNGCIVNSFELRNEHGALLGYFQNMSKDGYAGVRIMRAALQKLLLERLKAKDVPVSFGKALNAVKEEDTKIIASFSDGSTATADFLVGADGIHSAVRKFVVHPSEIGPSYTGTTLVYGILPTNGLPVAAVESLHETTGVFGRKGFFASAFCDNSRTRLYWISSCLKEHPEKLSDPERIRNEELTKFGGFFDPIPQIIGSTNEFFSWPIYELPKLERWSSGRVVLVGDAAHALPPDKGQGVSQALEDIFILARVMETGHGEGAGEVDLERYTRIRQARVEKLREDMRRTKKEVVMGAWAAWTRDWAFWVALKFLGGFRGWIGMNMFDYDPDVQEI